MSNTIVIFGASGDLTSRKLIPALYSLYLKKRLPGDIRIVGCSRSPFTHDQWRSELEVSTSNFTSKFAKDTFREFASSIFYQKVDVGDQEDFKSLFRFLDEVEPDNNPTRIYYLSTAPRFFAPAIENLGIAHRELSVSGREPELRGNLLRRIVIEKPFGTDLESAHLLNEKIHQVFDESQVYRIDHYLGKETVQNMMVLRFANSIFEPLWNRNYIDNVQIVCSESVDVGRRGGYYDSSGVLRDMFQNHLLQLLMITAMECPARFNASLVRDEKVKVLQAIKPFSSEEVRTETYRAQYDGYLDSDGVPAGSKTATFAAIKLKIENWRWNGVPFYLSSGKALAKRSTQIVIQFHDPPTLLFTDGPKEHWDNNRLIIQIQPDEGIRIRFTTKVPDAGMELRTTDLDFNFAEEFTESMPDSYQRLLLDAIKGDASLFARSDEVEFAWKIIDPIIKSWQQTQNPKLYRYHPGVAIPESCDQWMHFQKKAWCRE